jgi:hypothetical protein
VRALASLEGCCSALVAILRDAAKARLLTGERSAFVPGMTVVK